MAGDSTALILCHRAVVNAALLVPCAFLFGCILGMMINSASSPQRETR